MNRNNPNHIRTLGLSPSSRGLGFAVLEGPNALIDWGVKTVKRDNLAHTLSQVEDLLYYYQPGMIVVRDCTIKAARCSKRVALIIEEITKLASRRGVPLKALSRKEVKSAFPMEGEATKHAVAQVIAAKFPDELGSRLPAKRRPWTTESSRMGIFEAVALSLTLWT